MDIREKRVMAHRREKFSGDCVQLVNGDDVPVALEAFGGMDGWGRLRRGRLLDR
jgi:hypothetical protein